MPHLKFQSFVVMLPLLVIYAPECLGLNKLNPTYTQGYALWLAGFTVSILQDCFPLLFVFFLHLIHASFTVGHLFFWQHLL